MFFDLQGCCVSLGKCGNLRGKNSYLEGSNRKKESEVMNSPRNFEIDTYHHLYNRGVNKNKIFFNENDYLYFLKKLLEYKQKYKIEILAYCLMPNHFHLFIHQTTKEKLGSAFVGNLTNSYTKTINKKYKRTGVLFESRTKNKIVFDERAFKFVVKYILLNPVRAQLVNNYGDYKYSSAKELLDVVNESITDKNILKYFSSIKVFNEFILQEDEATFEGKIVTSKVYMENLNHDK